MLNIIINSISEKVKDFSKLFLKYFISFCSAWGLRCPSAPSLAPRIFIFGSSRFFRNFCARAIFFFSACPRLHGFSARISEISEPFSFSSLPPCSLAFFCVALLFFGVSLPLYCVCLLSFCVGILSFYTVVFSSFLLCNILLTVLCSKIIFLCVLIILKRGCPLVLCHVDYFSM